MNKHSIKFKITLLIGGMICVLIVLLLVFNIIFSEKFYMEDKQQEMLNAYSSVNDACIQYSDDSISETDLRNNLEQISTSKGISMIIVNSDWTTFYVSTHGDEMLLERLKKSIFNNDIFQNIMKKQADKIDKVRSKFGKIEKEEVSLEDKMDYLTNYATTHKNFSFRNLLESSSGKIEVIVTFLAILELMKMGRINISQEHIFDDILIESRIAA